MSNLNRTVEQVFRSIAARANFIERALQEESSTSEKMEKVWTTWRDFVAALEAFYGPRLARSILCRTPKK